jgi:hypothetical protein
MHTKTLKCFSAGLLACALATPALAANVVTKVQNLGALGTPSSQLYSTSFNLIAANSFSTSSGATLTAADLFYENYAFTIAPSTLASLTSTLSFSSFFGIEDLQARLYQGDVNTVITGTAGPALVQAWGQSFDAGQSTVTNALIAPLQLSAGSYVLQVRGRVSGDFGGSYTGNISLSPIPEPQTYAMLAAGLLAIGTLMQRSRNRT